MSQGEANLLAKYRTGEQRALIRDAWNRLWEREMRTCLKWGVNSQSVSKFIVFLHFIKAMQKPRVFQHIGNRTMSVKYLYGLVS